jgi:DNA-binding NarL/FixJ family response regulator
VADEGRVIRVAVVDDQALVRGGLCMLVGSQPDMEVVVEAADGAAAVRDIPHREVDVVVMDVRMPRLDGIEATRMLLAGPAPLPRVIMLTTFDLDEHVFAALRVGASGFLLKDVRPQHLLDAIRTVHRGSAVISPAMTRRLLDHVVPLMAPPSAAAHDAAERIARLTGRESEVFDLIAAALSNAEIASRLHLSETTVKTHVKHILAKLEARDRVQVVVLAHESRSIASTAARSSSID